VTCISTMRSAEPLLRYVSCVFILRVSLICTVMLHAPPLVLGDAQPAESLPDRPVNALHVSCETTKGRLLMELYPSWSPHGVKRFLALVVGGFFTDIGLFRCVRGFLCQFGPSGSTAMNEKWQASIPDDPNKKRHFPKGTISFAGSGPNSRSYNAFFTLTDLTGHLGKSPWETPIGRVVMGMKVLDSLYMDYGDIPPWGKGPDQNLIIQKGNSYLRKDFPHLDYIKSCSVLEPTIPGVGAELLYREL